MVLVLGYMDPAPAQLRGGTDFIWWKEEQNCTVLARVVPILVLPLLIKSVFLLILYQYIWIQVLVTGIDILIWLIFVNNAVNIKSCFFYLFICC